jgi:hypothetical protein
MVNVHAQIIFQIYDWRPEFYNDTTDLPEKMPRDLKDHIAHLKKTRPLEVSEFVFLLTHLKLGIVTVAELVLHTQMCIVC